MVFNNPVYLVNPVKSELSSIKSVGVSLFSSYKLRFSNLQLGN